MKNGVTPLFQAVLQRELDVVRLLLEYGADSKCRQNVSYNIILMIIYLYHNIL